MISFVYYHALEMEHDYSILVDISILGQGEGVVFDTTDFGFTVPFMSDPLTL